MLPYEKYLSPSEIENTSAHMYFQIGFLKVV